LLESQIWKRAVMMMAKCSYLLASQGFKISRLDVPQAKVTKLARLWISFLVDLSMMTPSKVADTLSGMFNRLSGS
jgi:hypothetical protein